MVIVQSRRAGLGLELVETKYAIRYCGWRGSFIHSQTAQCVRQGNVNTVLRVRPGHELYVSTPPIQNYCLNGLILDFWLRNRARSL
jgi:hypothetical protein